MIERIEPTPLWGILWLWPLLPIAATLLISAFSGEDIKKVKGKRFVILGERAVGKTVLHNFLRTGILDITNYIQTFQEELKGKGEKIKMKDLEFQVGKSVDIGGSDDFKHKWADIIRPANVIVYIINAERLVSNTEDSKNYISKIKTHLNLIEQKRDEQHLFLLVSHMDKLPRYNNQSDRDKVVKEIEKLLIDNKIIMPKSDRLFGHLKDAKGAEEFVYQMFDILTRKK